MRKSNNIKEYLGAGFVLLLFVVSAFFSQEYADFFSGMVFEYKLLAGVVYFLVIVLAIVIIPLTSIPLIPIITGFFGVFWTVVLSVFGWTIGSIVAFWIAKKYGIPVVERFFEIKKWEKFYSSIPEERMFWYLIFLRIVVPVDILSYLLGIFTKISWKMFVTTTALGLTPVVISLAYFGTFSAEFQLILAVSGVCLLGLFIFIRRRYFNNRKNT
ncbi:MAG: VTT domain-containing protein [Candidatus Moranbacteria bacterium]|nr:VTT domain-containing protein [Candidatus Moranbacteria bacterium]